MPHTSDDESMREYRVTPRYLAGPTFSGDLPLQPFLDLGWHPTHDEVGNLHIASPDQTVRVGYLPEGTDPTLWQITTYSAPFAPPRWQVSFDNRVPTEIVRDFTNTLAEAYEEGPDSYLNSRNTAQARLAATAAPLTEAGWSHRYTTYDISFHSPDALAAVHLRRLRFDRDAELQDIHEMWLMTAGTATNQWYARASLLTPERLVAAMNTAIADPEPAIRYGSELRLLPPQATVTPVRPATRPTSSDVERAQAAKARSTTTPPTAGKRPVIPAQRSSPPPEIPGQRHAR